MYHLTARKVHGINILVNDTMIDALQGPLDDIGRPHIQIQQKLIQELVSI